MPSMKAKKGNPFEYDVAYSLIENKEQVTRIDDNTAGVDLVLHNYSKDEEQLPAYIECKRHKAFSWNQLIRYFMKTEEYAKRTGVWEAVPLLVFKANQQPTLVMFREHDGHIYVTEFSTFFHTPYKRRAKGVKLWKKQ